jgi:hypothetical protein
MENKYLIGLGAIALGMFAYSRYAKKDDSGQGEDQGGGGGGIGGGGFMPNLPTPPIPPTPPTPPSRPPNQGRIIDASLFKKDTIPTKAITSSVEAQKLQTVTNTGITGIGMGKGTNTGGITGAGTGTGTGTTSGGSGSGSGTGTRTGSVTGAPARTGPATQLFSGGYGNLDGSAMNCKTPIYLNDLVRSWNRP